ncbi:hypothetical protein LINPERPRIM_LOCUS41109, partial [Linum perenne]
HLFSLFFLIFLSFLSSFFFTHQSENPNLPLQPPPPFTLQPPLSLARPSVGQKKRKARSLSHLRRWGRIGGPTARSVGRHRKRRWRGDEVMARRNRRRGGEVMAQRNRRRGGVMTRQRRHGGRRCGGDGAVATARWRRRGGDGDGAIATTTLLVG